MTISIISSLLAVFVAFVMVLSGSILISRIIRYRDPFDVVCTVLWAASAPLIALLVRAFTA